MTLTFDAAKHRYYWDGEVVPNVTTVLSSVVNYSAVPLAVLEKARLEGTAIHKMIEYYVNEDLDIEYLPDWLRPRLAAFQKFMAETQFEASGTERRIYHPAHKYAGTLDLDGLLNNEIAIIDIKRSLFAGAAIGLQLAAYMEAENVRRKQEKLPKAKKRYALQLKANGDYRLEPYDDPNDFAVFLALLTVRRWKEKNESSNA